jgi:hypothetical protein
MLTAGSLVIPTVLAIPAMGKMARPWAEQQVAAVDASVSRIEQALATKDWDKAQKHAKLATSAMTRLSAGPAVTSLTAGNEPQSVDEMRGQLTAARDRFGEAQQAIASKDASRLEAALKQFREAYAPLQAAARSGR